MDIRHSAAGDLNTHEALTGASVHGLGTISTQAASAVAITGGAISATTVGMAEVNKTATGSLSAPECTGTIITNYGQGAAMTLTLPTAVVGLNFVFSVITTGNAIHLDPQSGDKVYLDGTAMTDGYKVSCAVPVAGYSIAFFTFKSGAATYDWIALTQVGVFTDGGA